MDCKSVRSTQSLYTGIGYFLTHFSPEKPTNPSRTAPKSIRNALPQVRGLKCAGRNADATALPRHRHCEGGEPVAQYAGTRPGAAAHGRLAQRERRCLTSTRSRVQITYRPPESTKPRSRGFLISGSGRRRAQRGGMRSMRFERGCSLARDACFARQPRGSRLFADSGALPLAGNTP